MIRIDEPFHGAILNHRTCRQDQHSLAVSVCGHADLGSNVTVNGIPANRAGERIPGGGPTDTEANGHHCRGRGCWRTARTSHPRALGPALETTLSLFGRRQQLLPAGYRAEGLCVAVRLLLPGGPSRPAPKVWHEVRPEHLPPTPEKDFELPQFPDRYKGQWRDNADWLKLAFHAWAEFPDRPYQYASPEKLAKDLDGVAEQIVRFAGQEAYSAPTVIHFGMVQPTALPVLARRGVKVLSGMTGKRNGLWDIQYFLDDARTEYLSRHDAIHDFASGITFSNIDIIVNSTTLEEVCSTLEAATASPGRAEILDVFTHEQYFWPFYSNHVAGPRAALRGSHPLGNQARLRAGLLPRGPAGR